MAVRTLPTNVAPSKHTTHPALSQLPAALVGHVISVYADNAIFDETAGAFITPETLTRLGK